MQFNDKATQAEMGKAIGISERSVRKFLKKQGINHKEYSLGELILKYTSALREIAAGRNIDFSDVNVLKEKALLLRARRKLAEKKLSEDQEINFRGFINDEDVGEELYDVMRKEKKELLELISIMAKGEDLENLETIIT
ncbi:MAG: hypothetical protein KAG20_07175 [Cocleimonas sp.]|nr:hypothetical protein [Cocleimonas sp.]